MTDIWNSYEKTYNLAVLGELLSYTIYISADIYGIYHIYQNDIYGIYHIYQRHIPYISKFFGAFGASSKCPNIYGIYHIYQNDIYGIYHIYQSRFIFPDLRYHIYQNEIYGIYHIYHTKNNSGGHAVHPAQ